MIFSGIKKGDKIKRVEMINDYDKGGLNLKFDESLKIKWIQGYFNDNQGKWKLFVDYYLQEYGDRVAFLTPFNLKPQDVSKLNLKDPFFREIIELWPIFNYRKKNLDFNSMVLCDNSLIRIEKRPFFYKSWLKARI